MLIVVDGRDVVAPDEGAVDRVDVAEERMEERRLAGAVAADDSVAVAALEEFTGTIVVVSHDRYFLDRVCNRLLHLDAGRGEIFEGRYSEWIEAREEAKREAQAIAEREAASRPAVAPAKSERREKRKGRPAPAIEADIADVEAEIADLDTAMRKPEIASDHVKLTPLIDAHTRASAKLETLLAEWEAAAAE
jgi:ATP-binding cassette subfamily F protein 3